jgi:hypothetical protein
VDSNVGKGTTFDLFFPVQEAQPSVTGDAWRQLDRWADEGGGNSHVPNAVRIS